MRSGIPLKRGDRLRVETPGGGGYGDPFERSVELVLYDVLEGRVSAEQAERDYGLVVRGGIVERDTAARLRGPVSAPTR
jgi:N-methylhydantoinase B